MCAGSMFARQRVYASQNTMYAVALVHSEDGRPHGVLCEDAKNPKQTAVCVHDGAWLTLVGIPQDLGEKFGVWPNQRCRFEESADGIKKDVVRIPLPYRWPETRICLAGFAGRGVRAYLGISTNAEHAMRMEKEFA